MMEKQLEKLGLYKDVGNRYFRWCDGRRIEVSISNHDDFDEVWNKIYDFILAEGMEVGRRQKIEQIREVLKLDE